MPSGWTENTGILEQKDGQNPPEIGQNASALVALDFKEPLGEARAKSSLRMRYEAEVQLIKRKLGPLEFIRGQLGLTQRKMCQLLLVDPSAWTRWTREGEDAPPHIYRSLQWYLAIQDKYPALDVNFWLATVAKTQEPQLNGERDQRIHALEGEITLLRSKTTELEDRLRSMRQNEQENALIESRLRTDFETSLRTANRRAMTAALFALACGVAAAIFALRALS